MIPNRLLSKTFKLFQIDVVPEMIPNKYYLKLFQRDFDLNQFQMDFYLQLFQKDFFLT
jgi:hypothetical protein